MKQCLLGPGAGPDGAKDPASIFGPGPSGAKAPTSFFGPGLKWDHGPNFNFGPGLKWGHGPNIYWVKINKYFGRKHVLMVTDGNLH